MTYNINNFKYLKTILTVAVYLVAPAVLADTSYIKSEGNSLYFIKDTKEIKLATPYKGSQFLAVLDDGLTPPYALYLAPSCDNCSMESPSVYMQKIEGSGNRPFQFIYPGKITDPKKGQTVYEARAFYGQCLHGVKSSYVSFQKEIVDRRRGLQRSVFVAKPADEKPEEKLMERKLPAIETALHYVKKKTCFEVTPKNRKVLNRPLDLTPRKGLDDDEDETEEFERKQGDEAPAETEGEKKVDITGFEVKNNEQKK